ncbi:MAG: HAD hydrolase family protein [Patescibacteria group bacterium]|mgnify:CR=1 FL=1
MNRKFKALMIDCDGTLIPNAFPGIPSGKVKKAITKASKYLHVGVATSRPLVELHHIIDTLSLSGPSIIDGGAQIIDFPSKKVLVQHPLKIRDYSKICDILIKYRTGRFVVNDNGIDIPFSKKLTPKNPLNIFILANPTDREKIENELSKIPTIVVHEILLWRTEELKGWIGLEITDASATKQHAILEVAKILGIDTHEIIGIGDGYTDFPLLMACGLKVAMGNAVENIKAIADYIAPPVEEDGVADVIERYVL